MVFHYIENIAFNGTASRSSDYYWKDKKTNITADLAITCEPTYCMYFSSAHCATLLHNPMQCVAWWMLTFPVDTMYITNVQIYHRNASKINLPFKKKQLYFHLISNLYSIINFTSLTERYTTPNGQTYLS